MNVHKKNEKYNKNCRNASPVYEKGQFKKFFLFKNKYII